MKKTDKQTKDQRQRFFFGVVGFFMGAFILSLPLPVNAQVTTSACDPDYYESLEARAWMEAQREIEQNQNLIVKPDSVLEYTCFDLFGAELAQHAVEMFSESPRWGTGLGSQSMDNALTALVGSSIASYQTANFAHSRAAGDSYKALGGRGIDKRKFSGNISGGSYTCDQMNRIWHSASDPKKSAKCYNFQENENGDGFFTFKQYEEMDEKGKVVRQLPQACEPDTRWGDKNKTALGKYIGATDNDTPWSEDREFEFLDNTKSCDESPMVKSGIQISGSGDEAPFDEIICVIPGCAYDPQAGQCVEGVPSSATTSGG